MRIGIYVDVAKDKEPRGVGYHIISLLNALACIDTQNQYLLYYQQGVFARNRQDLQFPRQANFSLRPVRFPDGWNEQHPRAWWKYYLPWIANRDRIDVFHGPSHFVPEWNRARTVVTIHDLAYFKTVLYSPEYTAALQQWTRIALASSRSVIAISRSTWTDLEELGVEPERLRLIYPGGNIVPEEDIAYDREDELRKQFHLPDHYIVFVGTLGLRKNLQFLLRSYAALKQALPELRQKLVLVGKKFVGVDELENLSRQLGIADDVTITGYVEAWQIPLLYKLADLFVLPALYEGFGMTTIESMAYGTPVIAADTSSIREVNGDAAVLVPVDNVEALTQAMRRILMDKEFSTELVRRGRLQAEQFSWQRCARETLELYENIYHGSNCDGRTTAAPNI